MFSQTPTRSANHTSPFHILSEEEQETWIFSNYFLFGLYRVSTFFGIKVVKTLKTNTCQHWDYKTQIMQSGNPLQTGQRILQGIRFLKLKAVVCSLFPPKSEPICLDRIAPECPSFSKDDQKWRLICNLAGHLLF